MTDTLQVVPAPDGVLRHRSWGSVVHGFTTKKSYQKGDRLGELLASLGLGRFRPASLRQVHGNRVVVVRDVVAGRLEGDALVTTTQGILLTIATADCLPVLLRASTPQPSVAAVHCGWRGLRARIIEATLKAMRDELGVRAGDVSACLGPAIEMRCYEVGPEIEVPFGDRSIARIGERLYLDLAAEAWMQLEAAGLDTSRIARLDLCTRCHPELFYSYRRDGASTGRMINFVGLAGA
ncbi:MAG: peptidoglycan editing factor PgeF [Acidobacteriota bacterium]